MARDRGRKVRIDLRKNRAKPAREKGEWTRRFREGQPQHDDTPHGENVRAKGDLSRKRTIIVGEEPADPTLLRDGVVVTARGLFAEVDDGQAIWACTIRRMLRTTLIKERGPITVGDRVRFAPVEAGGEISRQVSDRQDLPEGVIEDVQARRTVMVRHYERRLQVVAANIDAVVIVLAADQPTLRPHLIDRYLVAIHQGDLRPVICINKADLDAAGEAAKVAERYGSLGYRVFFTCVPDGRGIDDLRDFLRGQTSLFVGPSGVGKSSLLNTIEPGFALKIGTLTDFARGRHTTTTARLLKWAFGGYVVDTPGMRQFDLPPVEATELEAYFKEFVELVPQCRFPSCTHRHEEDCAIRAAVDDGRIEPARYESYCKMYDECAAKPKHD